MIKSILANMRSDDDFTRIIVMVPLTDQLMSAIKQCIAILEDHKDILSSIKIGGDKVEEFSFPSEQFAITFRGDLPEEGTATVIRYALKANKPVYATLEVEKNDILLYAVDQEDNSYGYMFPITVPLVDVLKTT